MLGSLALGLALGIAINVRLDIYGLFRDDRHRQLPVYGDERIAKYLLCERYVPENFEGLLLGPSITSNWNPRRLTGLQIYNASLNGGNIVEEKAVADQALQSGSMHVAFLLIHPALTLSHDFQTVVLTRQENIAALGSQSLLTAYKDLFLRSLHPGKRETDGAGTQYFDDPHQLNAINVRLMRPGIDFEVDSTALHAYSDLLREFHARQVQVVLIVPPLSEPLYQRKPEAFAHYRDLILAQTSHHPLLIDFTTDQYRAFREDSANFSDGVHLTQLGADRALDQVNQVFQAARQLESRMETR